MKTLSPVECLFCCALANDPEWHRRSLRPMWLAVGDQAAWAFACQNEAESIVALALRNALRVGELSSRWSEAISRIERTLQSYMAELDRVAACLATDGIRLVALKNSGIARAIFPEWAGCPMGDVDVLVDSHDFKRAHERLLTLGYRLSSRGANIPATLRNGAEEGGTEYTLVLPDGGTLWFELQWRPVAGRWIRPDQEPDAGELLERSLPCTGTPVRVLAPSDNLLQVCLHTAKHSYVRAPGFRLHTDVDRIVRHGGIEWDRFVAAVEVVGVKTAVYFALAIPAELLATPVPTEVIARLRPPGMKERWVRRSLLRAGLFNSQQRKWGKFSYIIFNLLLYDSFAGALKAVFPDPAWIRRRYRVRHRWTIPWWYAARIFDLLFKRTNT